MAIEPAPATRFGSYVLFERLSRGGMGEIWKARRFNSSDQVLAIKRMLPELAEDDSCVQMFLDEGRIATRLDHPHVIRTYEAGTVGKEPYIAMEYLAGYTLRELLRAERRSAAAMSPGLAAYVLRAVCDGLDYVHRATDDEGRLLHLVHRDATPSNVLVGLDGDVKLLDFGIAKPLRDEARLETAPGLIKGKEPYLAPEQRQGGPSDHRADVFSAGVTLYEALTGQHPDQLDPLKAPSQLNSTVPGGLDEICRKALASDPELRYRSAGAMAGALADVVVTMGWDKARLRTHVEALFAGEASTVGAHEGARSRRESVLAPEKNSALPLLGAALVVGALAAFALWSRPAPPDTTAPAVPRAPVVAAAATPSSSAEPSLRTKLRLETTPPGAQVLLEGDPAVLGRTPLEHPSLQPGVYVALRLAGYQALRVTLPAHGPARFILRRLQSERGPARRRTAPLEAHELADPFAAKGPR